MAYDIGIKIGIEGEKAYKQALQEIANGQKVMRSEMELVTAKFSGQEKSIEALTAKHDVLQRTLYGEEEKIEKIREALQNAATSFGESDKRTQAWQVQLNKAEAELIKTQRELSDTETAMSEFSDSYADAAKQTEKFGDAQAETNRNMTSLGSAVDTVAQKFGVHLPQGLTAYMDKLGAVDVKTLALVGSSAALAAALVKVEQKLISMTKESASYADNIATMSTVTGISAERLQEYTYAAELLDVSVETITASQTKLIKSMASAQEGSAAQVEAFKNLGVAVTNADGSLRSADDVFWDVIASLGKITSETDRDAAAMEILGKSARDLNPLIEAGAEGMAELADEAHQTGYILDSEALDALTSVDDAMQRFNRSTEGAKNQLSAQFAPGLEQAKKNATDFVNKSSQALQSTHLVDNFGKLLSAASGLLEPIGALISWGAPGLSAAFDLIAGSVAIVADTLTVIVGMLKVLSVVKINEGIKDISRGLGYGITSGDLNFEQKISNKSALQTNVYDPTVGGWVGNYGYNAPGTRNWRGGLTWVGENGPELVHLPKGTQIESAQESRNIGGDTFYITIDAGSVREFNDIVNIAKNARMNARKGGIK